MVRTALASMLLLGASCARSSGPPPQVPEMTLDATDGRAVALRPVAAGASATVLVFFSQSCHCLKLHEDRLRALYASYHPRRIELMMVDSEPGASVDRDRAEAERRGYPFPILIDPQARLARALGAEYATYTVVLDASGRVAYRGGIDTDEMRLSEGATPYVANALEDVLAGRPPRVAHGKALGCALER